MSEFLVEFQAFFTLILTSIGDLYVWLSSTIIGEIILFILIMYIFLFVVKLVIDLKN